MTDQLLHPSDELLEAALAHRAPRGPDPDLLRQIAAAVGQTPQARRWWPLSLPGLGEPTRRLVWVAVVLMLTIALALGAIVAGGLPRSPALVVETEPEGSAASTPTPSVDPNAPVAIEDVDAFRGDATYTSRNFEPRVTFRLRSAFSNSSTYLIPSSRTSARSLVIEYRGRAGEEVRLIRPYAVDCGTPDEHPDAAALAAAILARPGMANVRDLGTEPYASKITSSSNLIHGTYPKRVLKIDGTGRTFDAGVSDPDSCRLLPEPGSGDPTIEIRGDMAALLILTDVGGELVVIRASDRGYDARTGAAFFTRDYVVDPTALTASPLRAYLDVLLDLETVDDPPSNLPQATNLPATPAASPSVDPSAAPEAQRPSPWPVVAIEEAFDSSSGTVYTSSLFEPRVTFTINPDAPNSRPSGEWCGAPLTSPRIIVLRHAKACVHVFSIIRPASVDCGLADVHPDADTLAKAVLSKLGASATEVSSQPLATDTLPAGLFADTYPQRVIRIQRTGRAPFDASADDPDRCRLLPEPGSDDPVVEVRGDIAATLVLLDVDGELIVVRVALGGHDRVSGIEAHARGYDGAGSPALRHLLEINHDIRFE